MTRCATFVPKFQPNQRVRLTEEAIRCGVTLRKSALNMGTVRSQLGPHYVTVLPDGYKQAMSFSVSFCVLPSLAPLFSEAAHGDPRS